MKRIMYLVLIVLTIILMGASYRELQKISFLNTPANAEVVELLHLDKREYCVYEYVTNKGVIIARDKVQNIEKYSIGDIIGVHYNSEDNYEVSYYKIEMATLFSVAILLQIIFLLNLIIKFVRKPI